LMGYYTAFVNLSLVKSTKHTINPLSIMFLYT